MLVDIGHDLVDNGGEGALVIHVGLPSVDDGFSDRFGLAFIDDLANAGEVDVVGTELDGLLVVGFDVDVPFATAGVEGAFAGSAGGDVAKGGATLGRPFLLMLRRNRFGLSGDIGGDVTIEGDDVIGDIEVVATTADDENGGDVVFIVKLTDFIDEGCNRFLIFVDKGLHPLVANHEVGGGGIFVDK